MTTTVRSRHLQVRLIQLLNCGTRDERRALLDAARCVAHGSSDLALACRAALPALQQ